MIYIVYLSPTDIDNSRIDISDSREIELNTAALGVDDPPDLPLQYADFADVFDVKASGKLMSYKDYNYTIEIEEGKQPPYKPIYSLSAI